MSPWVQHLYAALDSPLGLVVLHENPDSAKAQYYQARKAHGDPALLRVSITAKASEPDRLYLFKGPEECPEEKPSPSSESTSSSTSLIKSG